MVEIAQHIWGASSGFTGVLKTAAARVCALGLVLVATAAPVKAISASTTPTGFVRTTVSAADTPGRHAASLIATPLLQAPVFSGRIGARHASSTGSQIVNDPTVAPARLDCFDARRPHAVFVTSGSFAGFTFRVTANGADSITVDALGFDLAQILAPGDAYEVRPLHTFASLFGADAATVPFAAADDAARADQLMISRDGAWRAYWFTGSTWRRAGAAGDAGDDVILPQDGIVVYRRAASELQVRFVGEAPATDAVISVPAGAVSTIANPFPTDASIGEFGFETVPGWRSGSLPEQADQIQVCAANTWRTFWHDGVSWKTSGNDAGADAIPAGTAMIVVRKQSASANPFALIARPYDL